jgi:hypothetical protein
MTVDRQHSLIGASTTGPRRVPAHGQGSVAAPRLDRERSGLHNTLTTTYDHDEGRTISVRGAGGRGPQTTTR